MTWVAVGVGGAAAIGGGALSFMGGQSQAKSSRQAMERYLAELRQQRQTFLDQPESGAIRKRLGEYAQGNVGYDPNILRGMRAGVTEDYGKSLADMSRITRAGGAGASGVYTPGRSDRTARLLGQNIASNRATSMRDISTRNADVALNNQRFAISAMPTYLPGTPSTNIASPDVYAGANAVAPFGSYMGPALSNIGQQAGQYALYSPLISRMLENPSNPYAAMYMMNQMNQPYSGTSEMQRRLFPTN